MPVLAKAALQQALEERSDWTVVDGQISKTYGLATFPFAIEFVRQIADAAEEVNHHPDIDIRYNKVTIAVSTHDEKGITEKDLDLADTIDRIFAAAQ